MNSEHRVVTQPYSAARTSTSKGELGMSSPPSTPRKRKRYALCAAETRKERILLSPRSMMSKKFEGLGLGKEGVSTHGFSITDVRKDDGLTDERSVHGDKGLNHIRDATGIKARDFESSEGRDYHTATNDKDGEVKKTVEKFEGVENGSEAPLPRTSQANSTTNSPSEADYSACKEQEKYPSARPRKRSPSTFPHTPTISKSIRSSSPPLSRSSSTSPTPDPIVWQDFEITGHLGLDPLDGGYGINGIGFQPTRAQAAIRVQKRKQQVARWRARELKEGRERRWQRRLGGQTSASDGVEWRGGADEGGGDGGEAKNRVVRFA